MAHDHPLQIIDRNSQFYPNLLIKRLSKDAPDRLWAIGRLDLISIPKTSLFCFKRCPGDAIIKAMDQAQKWRDQGRCIISRFHSRIEKALSFGVKSLGVKSTFDIFAFLVDQFVTINVYAMISQNRCARYFASCHRSGYRTKEDILQR